MTGDTDHSKRQEKRDSLFLSATVRVGDRAPFSTRVRNLSAGGMMIDAAAELAVGTTVTAEMRGIGMVEGKIAWFSPGRAGVAFDAEIDPRMARTQAGTKMEVPAFLKVPPGRRSGLAIR